MNWHRFLASVILLLLGPPGQTLAHGTKITYQSTQAIAIQANYDTGEPMQQAQVVVYAPANPSQPWLQGTTDGTGQFLFRPDPAQPGNWQVKVRQAGHGDIVTIPVGEVAGTAAVPGLSNRRDLFSARASTPGLSPIQTGLMGAAVVWGFIGTALFFARGKQK